MPHTKRRPVSVKNVVRAVLGLPLVAYGPHPFSHTRDGADGARIGGYRLVRGTDGLLYGVRDDPSRRKA